MSQSHQLRCKLSMRSGSSNPVKCSSTTFFWRLKKGIVTSQRSRSMGVSSKLATSSDASSGFHTLIEDKQVVVQRKSAAPPHINLGIHRL